MLSKLRSRLTFANVTSLIALFFAVGGSGFAVASHLQVRSSDIVDENVRNADLGDNSVNASKVANSSLTGEDIRPESIGGPRIIESTLTGLDRCPSGTVKLARICVRSDGIDRNWYPTISHCTSLGLRVPTFSEALALAKAADVPGDVAPDRFFWTGDYFTGQNVTLARVVEESGSDAIASTGDLHEAVCVATPFN